MEHAVDRLCWMRQSAKQKKIRRLRPEKRHRIRRHKRNVLCRKLLRPCLHQRA
jgi:hypothetical protein